MNWLDKTIGWVAPGAGLRRARARAALEVMRGYEGARVTRRTEGWTAAGSSANAEIGPSLSYLRNRSRQLIRDNPHASRAVEAFVSKAVGTGIAARPDKGVVKAWKEWTKAANCDFGGELDFSGLQSLAGRTEFESGAGLIRRIRTGNGMVPLKLQLLEPDYIDATKHGLQANGNYALAGIEIDRMGRRQAYWLYDQHPGESLLMPRALQSRRVDAAEVIYFYQKKRPGQLLGVPRLAASVIPLRDYGDYREALLVKKKIEACFVAFVHGDPAQTLAPSVTDTTQTPAKRTETVSPGMIEYLGNDQSVTFGTPSSSTDGGYSKEELHAIAAGAGVTYEQMTGDLSGVNFSSIRAGMQDFKDLVETWRWIYFVPMVCERVFEWFLDAAWTAGAIRTRNYSTIWTPPTWPYVNPQQDIAAIKEEIKGGLQSISEKIRERGYDPDEVFAEIERERAELAAKGITVDTVAVPADAPKAPTDPNADPDADPDADPNAEPMKAAA